jgi:Cu/Ag efflux pump CusA
MIDTNASQAQPRETLIERVIDASARNKFLVFIFTFFAIAAGIYGLRNTPLDAIPDLSDVQVIVYTEWEGRSPDLVEDQVTYPISTVFIAAPKVKIVHLRHFSGWHRYLLGALARDRISQLCPRLATRRR